MGWPSRAAFVLWFLVAAISLAAPARAQGLGQWVSPGPLARDHAEIEGLTQCVKCHAPLQGVTAERCVACHERVGTEISTRRGFHADKGEKCGTCHPDHRGRDFELARVELSPADHFRETGFLLDGAHERTACTGCHVVGEWEKAEPECASCHDDPHGEVEHLELEACADCHSTTDWVVDSVPTDVFDHTDPKQTEYVLHGAHVSVACGECHFGAEFAPLPFDACTDCHRDPHAARFPGACTACHDDESWGVNDFDHARTGFVLEGLHATAPCASCHKGGITKFPAKHDTCGDCHKDVHRGQFVPRGCDTCHTVVDADFVIPAFDHAKTEFPLVGHHVEVTCDDCHAAGPPRQYRPVEHADCDACHEDPHDAQFEPTDCRSCHVETGWAVSEFDHDRTDFPLKGEHQKAVCQDCHGGTPAEAADGTVSVSSLVGATWSGVRHDSCLDCHDESQPHGTFFPMERCDECHDEVGFPEVTFAHAERTEFDLAPQHVDVTCRDCHEDLKAMDALEPSCRPCHQDDAPTGHYDGACEECHRNDAWRPADLGDRPHDITGYALVGTHSLLACDECHGPVHTPLAASGTACADCHADDDAHRNLIGAPCDDCHLPTSWIRTRFRHGTTGWPLRGAHRLAYCDDCHATRYAGTPNDCRWCHEAEAPRAEPAHQSAFFPQCDLCHRPYTWNALPTELLGTPAATAR